MSCIGRVMTHEEGTFEKRSIPPQGGLEWRGSEQVLASGNWNRRDVLWTTIKYTGWNFQKYTNCL